MLCLTSPTETRAHKWPAGLKVGLLCAATLLIVSIQNIYFQIVCLTTCLLVFALPGPIFFWAGMRALRPLWPFIAVLLIWHGFTADMELGLIIVLRLLTAVGLATLVTMTTRLSDMMDLIGRLLRPFHRFGFRPRFIELAIALVLRFTPAIVTRGRQLRQSWRARSARRAGWQLVLPLTVATIADAEQVAEALRARGGVEVAE